MNSNEQAVARHYGMPDLLARITAALEATGADFGRLGPDDLAPVDEFHIGGRAATDHALAKISLAPDQHVLDVGCGIGGPARYVAAKTGCKVTGIDLTPEYVATAKALTEMTGPDGKLAFEVANALAMPFEDAAFDAAITFHVAMNIPDRAALYGEIARVLKPGATLCIYDVMKKSGADLSFPVPWAESAETSHLATPDEMRGFLGQAGFDLREIEDRTEFALEVFEQSQLAAADGPPPLGVHLLLGPNAAEKFRNTFDNLEQGRIAPVLMIASRKS